MAHYVYKYVYNGEIIYIGKNDTDLVSRLKQHGSSGDNIELSAQEEINNSKIFYIELANSIMSDVVESELIRRYKPKYNKAKMSDWCGLPFVEPDWKEYILEGKKRKISKTKNINKYEPYIVVLHLKTIQDFQNEYYKHKEALYIAEQMEQTPDVIRDINIMTRWLDEAEPLMKSIESSMEKCIHLR